MASNFLGSVYDESAGGDLRASHQDPVYAFGAATSIRGWLGPSDPSGLYSNTWQDSIVIDNQLYSGAGDPQHPRAFVAGRTYRIEVILYDFEKVNVKFETDTYVMDSYTIENYGQYKLTYNLTAGSDGFYNICLNGWGRNANGSLRDVRYEVHISEAIQPSLPDLRDQITSLGTTVLQVGEPFVVNHTLSNQGTADASGQKFATYISTDASVTTGDVFLGELTTGAIAAGTSQNFATTTLALPTNLAPGTYYVAIIADYNGQVAESNESNNVSNAVQVTVKGASPLFTAARDVVNFQQLTAEQVASISANPAAIYDALGGDDQVRLPNGAVLLASGITWDPTRVFHAGAGGDTVFGGASSAEINGGAGVDVIYGGATGLNYLYGGATDEQDILYGFSDAGPGAGDARNVMFGGGGADSLLGGMSMDLLIGGAGADTITGGAGDDTLISFDPTLPFANDTRGDRLIGGDGDDDYVASGGTLIENVKASEDSVYLRKSPEYLAPLIVQDATGWKVVQLAGVASRSDPFDIAFRTLSVVTIEEIDDGLIPGVAGHFNPTALDWGLENEMGRVLYGKNHSVPTTDSDLIKLGFFQPTSGVGAPSPEAQLQAAAALTKYRDALDQVGEKLAGLAVERLGEKLSDFGKFIGETAAKKAAEHGPSDLIDEALEGERRYDVKGFIEDIEKIAKQAFESTEYSATDFLKDVSSAVLVFARSSWIATALDLSSPVIDALIKDVFDLFTTHVDEELEAILQGVLTNSNDVADNSESARDSIYFAANGNDQIYDGSGASTFIAGAGNGDDLYHGGAGLDTVVYSSAISPVTVDLSAGTATGSSIGSDSLVAVESVRGGAGNDVLRGSSAGDVLDGGLGADTMTGRLGNDIYYVDNVLDRIIEEADISSTPSKDMVFSSLHTFGLPENVERLELIDAAAVGIGNGDDNVITGNRLANQLSGRSGADYLAGGAGHDKITGNSGSDKLYGEAGNDQLGGGSKTDFLYAGWGDDGLAGGTGKDYLSGGEGSDLFVFYSVEETRPGGGKRDVVLDFDIDEDHFYLTYIDAKAGKDGDQAFSWRGGATMFSGDKGELHYFHVGQTSYVEGDIDGDGNEDFQIEIAGKLRLTEDHFFL